MEYSKVRPRQVPIKLLLESDPNEESILSYLTDAWCFVAKYEGEIVGACIAKSAGKNTAEIMNVAIYPDMQLKNIDSDLLKYTLNDLANENIYRVELGTGTFGYQLNFYQRLGFRVDKAIKDHFLRSDPEPIFENGIRLKDLLGLYFELLNDLVNDNQYRVELGTGTFGYQLTFYQRLGYRADKVIKDHFLVNDPEPVFANNVQLTDMLRLYAEY